ncbi:MAG: hypothetical protein WC546_04370 [Candidatus Omnitrophota bacterium]
MITKTPPVNSSFQSTIIPSPELLKELRAVGINDKDVFTRDPSNFADGNFKIITALVKALKSDKLFKRYPVFNDNMKKFVTENDVLSFPWSVKGDARRIYNGDKYLAQLSCGRAESTEISQTIVFKNKTASIDFDAYIVESDDQAKLVVVLRDNSGNEFIAGMYRLSDLLSTAHISVDISGKDWFLRRYQPVQFPENNEYANLRELYQKAGFEVIFRLECARGQKSALQLDNFKIAYR